MSAKTSTLGFGPSLRARFDDVFLLKGAERRAAQVPVASRARVRALDAGATERLRGADELANGGRSIAALSLMREAGAQLALAAMLSTEEGSADPPTDGDVAAVWARYGALVERGVVAAIPAEHAEAAALLAAPSPTALDAGAGDSPEARVERARAFVGWLGAAIEARTPAELGRARLRNFALALLVLALFVGLGVRKLTAKRNVALGAKLTASSLIPNSPAPSILVNGVVETSSTMETNKEPDPWVQLQLSQTYRVSRVVLINRGDGWFDEGLPFRIELSNDGAHWVTVGTVTAPFTQDKPAVLEFQRQEARYVKVHAGPGRYVNLSEIEVY